MSKTSTVQTQSTSSTPPCPSWCTQGVGHEYGSVGRHELARYHISKDYLDWSQIMALETRLDGPAVCEAPFISVCADAEGLNAEEAAEVVASLSLAIQQLAEINGAR
jgi:hypothetical protein